MQKFVIKNKWRNNNLPIPIVYSFSLVTQLKKNKTAINNKATDTGSKKRDIHESIFKASATAKSKSTCISFTVKH